MNKNKQLFGASLLMFCSNLSAGSMGSEPMMYNSTILPFVSLEGGYTWNQSRGLTLSTDGAYLSARRKLDGWTGRFAAGLLIPYCDTVSFSSEMAYGYYGQIKNPLVLSGSGTVTTINPASFQFRTTLSGFDLLAGVYYRPGGYELFLKGGALVENAQSKTIANLSALSASLFPGEISLNRTRTQVLPEVKLGAGFQFYNNFEVFGAWTHAFGATPSIQGHFSAIGPGTAYINANVNAPTIDVLTLGLQYDFA